MSLMLGDDMPADLLSGGPSRARGPQGEVPRFYMRTVPDREKSATEGRPCHKSAPYVEIRVPGDKTLTVDSPVTETHKHRFPREFAAFEAGEKEQITGTPLSVWPRISSPEVEDLKHLRIRTVEELAAVADGNLQALGAGGRSLRDEAKAWLEAAKGTAPISKMQAELSAMRETNDALRAQVEEMKKALAHNGKGK